VSRNWSCQSREGFDHLTDSREFVPIQIQIYFPGNLLASVQSSFDEAQKSPAQSFNWAKAARERKKRFSLLNLKSINFRLIHEMKFRLIHDSLHF